jgi:hypothetical protein
VRLQDWALESNVVDMMGFEEGRDDAQILNNLAYCHLKF